MISTDAAALRLRTKVIDPIQRRILLARIAGSEQAHDLTVPVNASGYGRIHHFRRISHPAWPTNPLPLDPASRALGLPPSDMLQVQAFQIAGCPWRCWYCFVPFDLLAGNEQRGKWVTAADMVNMYTSAEHRPLVIDLTGGSPDLAPEWPLWIMRELKARGLDATTYLWSDDNLSTDFFWRFLSAEERDEIGSYRNYGRVCCFKGFDQESFTFNTQAEPIGFERQFELMARLLNEKVDCYAYVTLTGPAGSVVQTGMTRFVDALQRVHHNLPLRTVPLRIHPFTPVKSRLNEARLESMSVQEHAIEAWNYELSRRFCASELGLSITDVECGNGRIGISSVGGSTGATRGSE